MNIVSISEYATLCGVSIPAIRNRIRNKKIKPVKKRILGRVYYMIDLDKTPVLFSQKRNVGRKAKVDR